MLLTAIVLWFHIFAAAGWLGGAMAFGLVVGPSLPGLSPQSRTELVARVFPRFFRFVEISSMATLVFGLVTVVVVVNGDISLWNLSNNFQILISAGAVLALVATVVALTVITPAGRKMVSLSQHLLQNPGQPPPELLAASKRLRAGAAVDLVLLTLVTILMVAGVNL